MRALCVVLAGVALLVGFATQPASAGGKTDFEQLIKQIGKFAVNNTISQKPKGLCVCQDGSGNHTRAGALFYSGRLGDLDVGVYCLVRSFWPEGSVSGETRCDTFEILSK